MTFRFSSWLYGRLLGVVCLIAFVSLGVQVPALYNAAGFVPIDAFVASAQRAGHALSDHPTLFWFASSDATLMVVVGLGVAASLALTAGFAPAWSLLLCWCCYLSFVSVGWPFLSFQWDTLLLEVSFASMFFVPWVWRDRLADHREPSRIARWALWWILIRLMFRSAYVKLGSGDATWANLTALDYHYWTQPLPTALAWYAHQLPAWVHRVSGATMFAIEFGAPLLVLVPRPWARRLAALLVTLLMLLIAATGNYGFFNILTVVLCVSLLDDSLFARGGATRSRKGRTKNKSRPQWKTVGAAVGAGLVIACATVVFVGGTFSESRLPWMRPVYATSTFNNYGLFAVMTTSRREIVLEGTRDGEDWKPYGFAFKPGDLNRAPAWNAPHQPRLDWQLWFAALSDYRRHGWLAEVMKDLLRNDPATLGLFAKNPFTDAPPKKVRAVAYDYTFTNPEERRATGDWWKRKRVGLYAPVLDQRILAQETPVPPSPQ